MIMIYKEKAPRRTDILQKGQLGNIVNSKYIRTNGDVNTSIKAQGKIIGYLQDHTFVKRVQGSKHMLRKPPAWCISKEAFCEKVLPNTENIVIEDLESGRIYECPTPVFAEHAFEIQRGNFEPQLALVLRFWEVRSNGHRQLSLWGESSA